MRSLACAALFCLAISSPIAAAITGNVVTPEGKAVPNATIRLFAAKPTVLLLQEIAARKGELEPLAATQTDAKGDFKLDTDKRGNLRLQVTAAGFAPTSVATAGNEDVGGVGLLPASDRSGTITGNGKPMAGAVLVLTGSKEERLVVQSDEKGHYTIPDASVWHPDGVLLHDDFARTAVKAFTASTPRYDLQLVRGVTVRGAVVAPDGKTPAHAQLSIDGWPAGETKDDGTFVIERVPADWKRIEALSENLVAAGTPATHATLRLARGLSLGGRVTDQKSGRSVAGANVLVKAAGVPVREGLTDARGSFIFAPLLAGELTIDVTHAAFAAQTSPLKFVATTAEKNIILTPLVTLRGRVVDSQRTGVGGVRLQFMDPLRTYLADGRRDFRSAADGRFPVTSAASPYDQLLTAVRAGYAPTKEGPFRLAAGEERSGLTLVLERGVAVRGKVVNADDQPVAGAKIGASELTRRMYSSSYREGWNDVPQSAKDGTFELRLNPGAYDLFIRAEGYATTLRHQVRAGVDTEPLVVRLERGQEVSGRVVDTSGTGTPQVNVSSWLDGVSESTVTDESGSFALSSLPSRSVGLSAYTDDGSVQEERSVKPPQRGLVIEVTPTISVSGRVIDKASNASITDFTVTAAGQETTNGGTYFWSEPQSVTVNDASGKFRIERVALRPTELRVTAPGYQAAKSTLKFDGKKDLAGLEIALEKGTRITGRVTDQTGAPLDEVSVNIDARSRGVAPGTQTEPDGTFVLDGVAPGETMFIFRKAGYEQLRKSVTVTATEARVDVQLGRGRTLSGHVVNAAGAPVADAEVTAFSPTAQGGWDRVLSDASGAFRFEGLAAGVYRVEANRRGYMTKTEQNVDIEKTQELTLRLEQGATIHGRVSGLAPADLEHVRVSARAERDMQFGYADATGVYRIDGAPVGSVTVRASLGGEKLRQSEAAVVQTTVGGDHEVDVEFKEGVVIRGRVTLNGKPMANGSVGFRPKTPPAVYAASDIASDGRYEVLGLQPGEYVVMVSDASINLAYTVPYIVNGSTTFDIDVAPASLRGRAIEAETNEAIGDVAIVAEQSGSDSNAWNSPSTTSDSDGVYTIPNLTPGDYKVRATKEGFGTVTQTVHVDAGGGKLDLRLSRTEGLTLRLIDARNGKPVRGDVILKNASGDVVYAGSGKQTPDGAMRIAVAPGTYRALIGIYGLATTVTSVTAPGTREITLTAGGSLQLKTTFTAMQRARIVAADGTNYPIYLGSPKDEVAIQPGTSTLEHIAPGSYTLQLLNAAGAVTKSATFTINEGQTTSMDF